MKPNEMRLLVCGGRDFTDKKFVFQALDKVRHRGWRPLVIHGGARGADSLAGEWAESLALEVLVFPADWKTHGKAAGMIRNKEMLDKGKPTHAVAFPGGRGTAGMVSLLEKANIYTWKPAYPPSH